MLTTLIANISDRNSGTSNNDGQCNKVFNSNDVAFIQITMKNNFSTELWILDNGATFHHSLSVKGLTEIIEIDKSIEVRNGDSMKATKVGSLKCEVNQLNGETFVVSLNDVKIESNLCINLFSLNKH
jgi:hypothetical protein